MDANVTLGSTAAAIVPKPIRGAQTPPMAILGDAMQWCPEAMKSETLP